MRRAVFRVPCLPLHAMIHDISMGKAVSGVTAMAEGDCPWRGHEAQGGKNRQCHRDPETWAPAQRC